MGRRLHEQRAKAKQDKLEETFKAGVLDSINDG